MRGPNSSLDADAEKEEGGKKRPRVVYDMRRAVVRPGAGYAQLVGGSVCSMVMCLVE